MDEHESLALGLRIARSMTKDTAFAEAADYASAAAMAILAADVSKVVDREPYLWSVGRMAIIDEYRRTHGRHGLRHADTVELTEQHDVATLHEERLLDEARPVVLTKRLTRQQREALRLAACGETAKGIALLMGIGVETVTTHLKKARATLDARTVAHAVALAIGRGEIPLPPHSV